jgi:hypothetical protein
MPSGFPLPSASDVGSHKRGKAGDSGAFIYIVPKVMTLVDLKDLVAPKRRTSETDKVYVRW